MKLDPKRLQQHYPLMTPEAESRMLNLIHGLPSQMEEKPMKRIALRTILIFSLITILLCGTAFALVNQGLEWYYNHRFTAYQIHEPEKYQAIIDNLQFDLPQNSQTNDEIAIAVQNAAWIADQHFLAVSFIAAPRDPDTVELHPLWNLDADGAYVGNGGCEAPESDGVERAVHWLWTQEGFGPVSDMVAPGKELLLINMEELYLEGYRLLGDGSSADSYRDEEGHVHTILEIQLDFLKPGYEKEMQTLMEQQPELKTHYQQLLEQGIACKSLIENDTDGIITLTAPYTLTHYTEDDQMLYHGEKSGTITFQLKIQ